MSGNHMSNHLVAVELKGVVDYSGSYTSDIRVPEGSTAYWFSGEKGCVIPVGWRLISDDLDENPYMVVPPNLTVMIEKL